MHDQEDDRLRVAGEPVVVGRSSSAASRRRHDSSGSSSSFGGAICTLVFVEHFGIELEQLERAGRGDALAALEAVGHLRLAGVADADGDLAQVRLVVLVDHDGERRARRAGQHRLSAE